MTYTDEELNSFWLEAKDNNGCKAMEDAQGRDFVAFVHADTDLLRLLSLEFQAPVTAFGNDVHPGPAVRFTQGRVAPTAAREPWRQSP